MLAKSSAPRRWRKRRSLAGSCCTDNGSGPIITARCAACLRRSPCRSGAYPDGAFCGASRMFIPHINDEKQRLRRENIAYLQQDTQCGVRYGPFGLVASSAHSRRHSSQQVQRLALMGQASARPRRSLQRGHRGFLGRREPIAIVIAPHRNCHCTRCDIRRDRPGAC